jgi:predicted  nucleic acid-binding Zn-ribbon protein
MKKVVALGALSLFITFNVSHVQAAEYGCDVKRAEIEGEIGYAKAHNNRHKLAGLEDALDNVNKYCTNEKLLSEAMDKADDKTEKLNKEKAELAEIEADLATATAEGNRKKVSKYQDKIAEQKSDISKAQSELDEAMAEVNGLKALIK